MSKFRNHYSWSVPALLLALILPAVFVSCSVDDSPQAVALGQEDCVACQMTIVDGKFACEYITDKGKCFKFDDLSCLFNYLAKNNIDENSILKIYVGDYEHPDKLIDLKTAALVLGVDIASPMGGGVAAFSNRENAVVFATSTKSELLTSWTVLRKTGRLEDKAGMPMHHDKKENNHR
jgi:copper chaperone NosL